VEGGEGGLQMWSGEMLEGVLLVRGECLLPVTPPLYHQVAGGEREGGGGGGEGVEVTVDMAVGRDKRLEKVALTLFDLPSSGLCQRVAVCCNVLQCVAVCCSVV